LNYGATIQFLSKSTDSLLDSGGVRVNFIDDAFSGVISENIKN